MKDLLEQRVISQAEFDRAITDQRTPTRSSERCRPRSSARRFARRSPASSGSVRSTSASIWPQATRSCCCSRSVPIYVNFGVPQQDAGADSRRPARARHGGRRSPDASSSAVSRRSTRWSTRRRATSRCRRRSTNPAARLRPGMFVQTEVVLGASRSVITLPAPAISYAPYGDSVFIVTDHERTERRSVSRRAAAVRQAGRRRAAIRSPCSTA